MRMNTQEGLIEARRRIEAGWTRELLACDAKGEAVFFGSLEARAYCAAGAVLSLAHLDTAAAISFLSKALPTEWCESENRLSEFNDDERTTKEDVLALYDRAIAYAGGAV